MDTRFSKLLAALKPKRRWFQYSLRTLFIITTLFAVCLGVWTNRGRKQQRAIAIIERSGGKYYYYYNADESDLRRNLMLIEGESSWAVRPQWARRWVPDEYLADIAWVDLNCRLNCPVAGDDELRVIGGLTGLRRLDLVQTDVTDEGLRHLYGCKKLEEVYLMNSKATAQGVQELHKALPNCKINLYFRW